MGGKTRRKETNRKPRFRWVEYIEMDLGEIGWDGKEKTGNIFSSWEALLY
jgi:hypothetical protein